jgi:hypothetical protein
MICAGRRLGTNDKASAIAKHRPRFPIRKRLKASLEPDRRSNADLIVIEAEELCIAAVLAVQVVHAGAQPPGNQNVKRGLNKPVIVIARRINIIGSGEVICVFIADGQAEVNAME